MKEVAGLRVHAPRRPRAPRDGLRAPGARGPRRGPRRREGRARQRAGDDRRPGLLRHVRARRCSPPATCAAASRSWSGRSAKAGSAPARWTRSSWGCRTCPAEAATRGHRPESHPLRRPARLRGHGGLPLAVAGQHDLPARSRRAASPSRRPAGRSRTCPSRPPTARRSQACFSLPPGAAGTRLPAVLYFGGNAEEVDRLRRGRGAPVRAARGAPHELPRLRRERRKARRGGARRRRDRPSTTGPPGAPTSTPARICVHGRSLGTGSRRAARRRAPAALRRPHVALRQPRGRGPKRHYPWLPVGLLLRHRFDSAAVAGRIAAPALVAYGAEDDIIPAGALRAPRRRLGRAGGAAAHRRAAGTTTSTSTPATRPAIAAFLDRHL